MSENISLIIILLEQLLYGILSRKVMIKIYAESLPEL